MKIQKSLIFFIFPSSHNMNHNDIKKYCKESIDIIK